MRTLRKRKRHHHYVNTIAKSNSSSFTFEKQMLCDVVDAVMRMHDDDGVSSSSHFVQVAVASLEWRTMELRGNVLCEGRMMARLLN